MLQKSPPRPLTLVLLLSGVFFLCFLIVSGVLFFSARTPSGGGKTLSASSSFFGSSAGAVGIIELSGIIMDSKRMLMHLESFEEDDQIKAVVLRVNSPGGVTAPSQEIYEAVKAYKKPLVVSMSSLAASGAYYISVGAKKIFANPGTLTGSIGVIMEFVNLEKLYEWAKIHRYVVKSGKHKDIGAEFRDLTPEEKDILQKTSDDILDQFKEAVAQGRNLSPEAVTEVATGQVFSGRQAKALGLVDELGTLQDAIIEAGKLGEIKDKPRVVYAEKRKRSILDYLILDDDSHHENSESYFHGVVGQLIHQVMGAFLGTKITPVSSVDLAPPHLAPGAHLIWQGGL